jgi:hypothetical protein
MKRNEPHTRPTPDDRKSIGARRAYQKPSLKRLGVLKSVALSDLKWGPRRY